MLRRGLFLFLAGSSLWAADPRIARVENGLLPRTVKKGESGQGRNILDRMKFHKVPAVSIAVVDNGDIAWAKAYGVTDGGTGESASPRTLFQAGSISKPVSAMGALKLVEQGKLTLDGDMNQWLKSWKVPDNDFTKKEKVTLRRLLSHSAGLTVHGFPGYEVGKPVATAVQVLNGATPANTAPVRVDVEPGSKWRYSGGGYTVMQLAVADTIGRPFETYMIDTVLKPIGMQESTYAQPLPEEWRSRAASGHRVSGEKVPGRFHIYPEMAAAGLWTTATDLARWLIEVQRSAVGRSNRVLAKGTVEQMLTEQASSEGGGFGLGPALRVVGGHATFAHGGRDDGFDAFVFAYATTGQGVAVMINANNNGGFVQEVVRAIAREYKWPGYRIDQREE